MLKRMTLLIVLTGMLGVLVYEYTQEPVEEAPQIAKLGDHKELEREKIEVEEVDSLARFEATLDILGQSTDAIVSAYGEPVRKEPSAFGYESWVYNGEGADYMVIGIEEGEVVTAFLSGEPVAAILGEESRSFADLSSEYSFEPEVEASTDHGWVTFKLNDSDVSMRPITAVGDHWMQVYMDVHTDQVSSVRLMNEEILLRQRHYSYSPPQALPETPEISEEEWKQVEEANARQIFDLTNSIRHTFELEPFGWSDEVADVAYLHSKDMNDQQYFDHVSPTRGDLGARFQTGEVPYDMAGENIAANYVDGLAAVEGWLNSEGHRVNLLHQEFRYLGVGVHREYYTQNFLKPQA
ncbi:CAP domain-containing protein [Shouchella shacheensis]|uniref:CAP domain-containing protein n=1 Tax=Shouchella shacheensis TaxID=1649580 RepID=UPI00073FC594|nr:CAP domain-containing protein [Shouchella shacheensis]